MNNLKEFIKLMQSTSTQIFVMTLLSLKISWIHIFGILYMNDTHGYYRQAETPAIFMGKKMPITFCRI